MKVVLVYSGGLDSTVLLYHLVKDLMDEVSCITFDYGQRHSRETQFAREVTRLLDVPFLHVDISKIRPLFGYNSQTGDAEVPNGHYTDEVMKTTVVPNRNMIFLSLAASTAISWGYDAVAYGCHSGDHAIYPDCRLEFVIAVQRVLGLCHSRPIRLFAPFTTRPKSFIVDMGHRLGVPFELTWSCYKGGVHHCGKCGTCVERKEAFALAQLKDPTIYEA